MTKKGNKKMKVGVVFGGKSAENEVSLATGRYVFSLLDPERFDGIPLYMDKAGFIWRVPVKLVLMNTTKDLEKRLKADAKRVELGKLQGIVDFVFIALLGKYGEDGVIQGILELLKIPYSGSGILASAVGMHKRVHKALIKHAGFLVAKDVVVNKKVFLDSKANIFKQVKEKVGYPCVVKPVMEGSSIGVSFVGSQKSLQSACRQAFKWDDEILIEEYLKGQEFMCVVIGNNDPVAMLPSEVEFEGDIFTYDNKYMPGQARYFTPIRAKKEKIKEIQDIAVSIYKLMGIKGYGRVDGFLVDKKKVYVSEPHTGTIMVPSSYVFQQAALHETVTKTKVGVKSGAALNPRRLITTIIDLGVGAHLTKIGTL